MGRNSVDYSGYPICRVFDWIFTMFAFGPMVTGRPGVIIGLFRFSDVHYLMNRAHNYLVLVAGLKN
jgi:hypothetical protein